MCQTKKKEYDTKKIKYSRNNVMTPDFHEQILSIQKDGQELMKKFHELYLRTIYMMLETSQMLLQSFVLSLHIKKKVKVSRNRPR